jgi:O-antigen/teichoic acid export membrane protein
MYGFGCILMVVTSRYWLKTGVEDLPLFYLLLIPPGIGIIFASPLYNALVGVRDLRFIFRMHLNLAVMNLVASIILIPLIGLYGAAVGLFITTFYNACAEYKRYLEKVGPIVGLVSELKKRAIAIIFALLLPPLVVLTNNSLSSDVNSSLVLGVATISLSWVLLMEPLSVRVAKQAIGKMRPKKY